MHNTIKPTLHSQSSKWQIWLISQMAAEERWKLEQRVTFGEKIQSVCLQKVVAQLRWPLWHLLLYLVKTKIFSSKFWWKFSDFVKQKNIVTFVFMYFCLYCFPSTFLQYLCSIVIVYMYFNVVVFFSQRLYVYNLHLNILSQEKLVYSMIHIQLLPGNPFDLFLILILKSDFDSSYRLIFICFEYKDTENDFI